jgi:tricorn protease
LRLTPALILTAILASSALADTTPHPGMLRQPAVSDSRIAFVFANQIWTAPRSGGTATLVASPPVRPALPRFSPDGKTIAFTANFDGNTDIYTVPVAGGELSRVTHHPAEEILCGWRDATNLLFFAGGVSDSGPGRITRLYSVPVAGGLPEKLPMPYSGFGAVSNDGKTVAFSPLSTDNRTWRRYRGGMAPDLWTMDLATGASKQITDWEGTDTIPMWGFNRAASTVYYLSDNGPEHRLNIWAYDTTTGTREQVTKFADDEVRFPSIGPGPIETRGKGEIIFQLGTRLMLLDLDTREARKVEITIPGARPRLRPQLEDAAALITAADLSPSGKRVLFTGRGDLWSVPSKEGPSRNLTRTDGVFERDGAWSPDGRWVAYLSDASGEYELYIKPSDARPAPKNGDKPDAGEKEPQDPDTATNEVPPEPLALTKLGPGFRYNPTWSPDSRHIVMTDQAGRLLLVDVTFDATGERLLSSVVREIDIDPWDELPSFAWSHDSAWLAYTRSDDGNGHACIWLCNVASGEKTQVTSPYFAASSPAFDRKGEFLYYVSAREITSPQYADGDTTFVYAGTQRLMMVPLRKDVKSPLAPQSDEEEIKAEKAAKKNGKPEKKPDGDKPAPPEEPKPEDKPKDGEPPHFTGSLSQDLDLPAISAALTTVTAVAMDEAAPAAPSEPKPMKIDLSGFESRAIQLPVPAGRLGNLAVSEDAKLLYIRRARDGEERLTLRLLDPKDDKLEERIVAEGVGGFNISATGKKLLVGRGGRWQTLDPVPGGGKAQDVPVDAMKTVIRPQREWKQIFSDAWRLQRDFFYVPNMHGVDWPKIREQYGAMVDDAASRDDIQFIIAEMISQLNIGHAYVQAPGDVDRAPQVGVGLLACDFEMGTDSLTGASAYRFKKIYRGAPWDAEARGPLAESEPEKDRIVEGEYLLAVNGVPVDISTDPWASFIGLVDKPTTLTVSFVPVMDGRQRDVLVTPVSGGADQQVRFRAWIEANRVQVDRATEGKVGYIYVPNTGQEGQNELFRQFFAQRDRAALIIDDRWNGGGQIPTRFIELLNRPVTNYWAKRKGKDETWPPDSHQGPMCMLINGQAGSGGDMFPWLFKSMKLGKIIGMRTWGGLVGISGNPGFIDGGSMSVPTFGFYKKDGTWGVEGHGVDPDILVVDDPGKMLDNSPASDPQLTAAIAHMLEEVGAHPYTPPARPEAPDRKGMGIPEKDR